MPINPKPDYPVAVTIQLRRLTPISRDLKPPWTEQAADIYKSFKSQGRHHMAVRRTSRLLTLLPALSPPLFHLTFTVSISSLLKPSASELQLHNLMCFSYSGRKFMRRKEKTAPHSSWNTEA